MIGIRGLDRPFSAKWLNPVVLCVAAKLARLWKSQGMTVEAGEFPRLPGKRCVLDGRCGKRPTQVMVRMGG